MKTAIVAMALLLGYLFVSEMQFRDEIAANRAEWLAANCLPQRPHEQGVITMRADGSTQCAVFENSRYGSAPRLVFAEVREQ